MTTDYHYFCGIDIGKRHHAACLLDQQGNILVDALRFANDAEGFAKLQERLQQHCRSTPVLVGMEATGHYWYALHDQIGRWNYPRIVINPLQSAQQIKNAIRKHKSDPRDAWHIARIVKNGEGKPAVIPGEKAMTCRQVTRLWYALMAQRTRIKLLLHSKLEWVWPEFETYLANPFGPTGKALLRAAPTPQDLVAMAPAALTELLEKASRKQVGADLARQIRASAEKSVGMRRGLEGVRTALDILLDQLEATAPVQQRLRREIEALAAELPGYLLTLPGIDPIRAVSLFGETDPISTFKGPEQLVAFAGLDLTMFQTGQYLAPRRKISKRGSPHLRRTLWTMAAIAIRSKGELRRYYQKKRKRGLHHLSAVTATALKLTRIVWRIGTDQRDYLPAGRPTTSATRS
jgi:transposase